MDISRTTSTALQITSTAKAIKPNQSAPLRRGEEVFSVVIACLLCNGISLPVRRFAKHTYYNSLLLYILRPQISIPNCNNFMNFPIFTIPVPGFIR